MFRPRPLALLLIALVAPFLLDVLAGALDAMINDAPVQLMRLPVTDEYPGMAWPTWCLLNLFCFGWGEEVGWRGYALPRLQSSFSALTSAAILAAFWALWHWPAFLYRPGYINMDMAGVLGWCFSLLTGSVLLTWLFNSAKGSLLACAILHTTVDLVFTSTGSAARAQYLGVLITLAGILVVVVYRPRDLSRQARRLELGT